MVIAGYTWVLRLHSIQSHRESFSLLCQIVKELSEKPNKALGSIYLHNFMELQPRTIFKIPSEVSEKQQTFVIGIIDASGSMVTYWEEMVKFWNASVAPLTKICITFSNTARLEASPFLSTKLKDHGGGGTNILSSFTMLEREIKEFIPEISFTIIFISDGQDTSLGASLSESISRLNGANGRYINFICLGVQSGFPTTVAMSLREKYHTGTESIPAVYLIEYASEKAFFNKFETMKGCFTCAGEVEISPPAVVYPWEKKPCKSFSEGTWVILDGAVKSVLIQGTEGKKPFPIPSLKSLRIDDLIDCFKSWIQKIQLLSIESTKAKENIIEISQVTLDTLLQIVKSYEVENGISILNENKNSMKTFKSRAVDFMVRNLGIRIKWYVEELMVYIKGVGTNQLSEYEAAKRIGIGTITGKYHQKALALKGITIDDFNLIKEEFKSVFTRIHLSKEPSPQEPSIFTLQNQKEVFQEPDFLEGLDLCKTQYDLVETFPVIGYSLKVKRYDGSMVNPWKVVVVKLARHHSSIDSMYLATNQNKFQLSVGDGAVEEINAVLPLFSLKDKELSPLLTTRLFKLTVSFMVVQNIDTYNPEAYLSLLASTYISLLSAEKNEWRDNLIQLIYESIKVTYGEEQGFQKKVQAVSDNPFELFRPDKEEKEEHVDISKVLIYVFYIMKEGILSKEKLAHLADLALCHFSEKTFVEHEFKLSKFIDISAQIVHVGQVEAKSFENFKELNQVAKEHIKAGLLSEDSVKLDAKKFIKEGQSEKQRVSFNHMREFYLNVTQETVKEEDVFSYLAHYLQGKDNYNYSKPVVKDEKLAKQRILKKFDFDTEFKDENYITKHLKLVKDLYLQEFENTHYGIVPMTQSKLMKLCQERNIDPSTLKLNKSSGLLSNSCQSPHCRYFLKPLKSGVMEHMRLWNRKVPPQFHLLVKKYIEIGDPLAIYETLDPLLHFARFNKDKDFVVKYINEIVEAWQQQ